MESAYSSWLVSHRTFYGQRSRRQQVYSLVHSHPYLGGQQTLGQWAFGSASGVYPSLLGFIATIAVFLIVIYLQGIRIELPMSYAGYKGFRSRYPIKLLYVSNLPVIFASALFANVYFFSQLLWAQFGRPAPGTNLFFQIIGDYNQTTSTSGSSHAPVGGLAYYVTRTTQHSRTSSLHPLQAAAYLGIIIVFCAVFSLIWLEVGGLGPSKVAQQLMDSGMQIPGYRRSGRPIEAILKRYIPVVTVLGGIIVGLVAGALRLPWCLRFRHRYLAVSRHHLPVLRTADA